MAKKPDRKANVYRLRELSWNNYNSLFEIKEFKDKDFISITSPVLEVLIPIHEVANYTEDELVTILDILKDRHVRNK